jgi:signal transduction histidine kinase
VSHELRTPLSVVVGFVYLLLNQVIGKLSEEQQKVLETVYRNSEELLELIDNVLWMTSLSSGDTSPILEKFDAREIVDEAVKRYQRTISEKNLTLTIDIPEGGASIISDRSKVERIFQNIFNNAVKFTSVGEIRVKARASADRGILDLEVSDTGIGIDKHKMDSVFEPFQQVDNSIHRSFSGLGLGLTVARRMAELIGGAIQVKSEPSLGTTVLMRFPSKAAASVAVPLEQRNYG